MSETFTPDNLIAGLVQPLVTAAVTILSGSGALARGTVLGKITSSYTYAAGDPAADEGNTGDGAMTMADPAVATGVKAGTYRLVCIEPATNAGKFLIEDPDGIVIGVATAGVAYDGVIKFTIADGDTDFAAGDQFTVAITATATANAGKYRPVNSANTDGSALPYAVLGEAVNATSADAVGGAFLSGEFNEASLVFGGEDTAATHRDEARKVGIIFRTAVSA